MQRRTLIHTALASLAAGLPALPALAQAGMAHRQGHHLPGARFPAGGTTDVLGRLIGAEARAGAGHQRHHRQQGRRRRQRRLGDRVARRARRLHAAGRHHQLARHQREPLSQDRLRPAEVLCAGHADRHQPGGAGGQPGEPLQDAEGRAGRPATPSRAGSPRPRPAPAPRSTWRWSCWPTSRASSSRTCPTRAAARRSRT